jgi:hypothetical protein
LRQPAEYHGVPNEHLERAQPPLSNRRRVNIAIVSVAAMATCLLKGRSVNPDSNLRMFSLMIGGAAMLFWYPLLVRKDRQRKRQMRGLCPFCGYDLRATPARCPECGAVPAKTH